MNNEITTMEKQFFETFGIEPKIKKVAIAKGFYIEHSRVEDYLPITDRILLELICILNNYSKGIWACNIDSLRCAVLNKCINILRTKDLSIITLDKFKHQVQALFKENNNE